MSLRVANTIVPGIHGPAHSIGVVREIKTDWRGRPVENRVIFTPDHIRRLVNNTGVQVVVEKDAGINSGYSNAEYIKAGARIDSRKEVLAQDIVFGVKETQKKDHRFLRAALHMSYEHFADAYEALKRALKTSKEEGTIFLALETMQNLKGLFPTLAPMSEAAAEEVAQLVPAIFLKYFKMLPSGLPRCHIAPLVALVLGGGIVGKTAAVRLCEMGLEVTILEASANRRRELKFEFQQKGLNIRVLGSDYQTRKKAFTGANVLVSGVYRRGAKPPKIVTKALLKRMSKQAVAFFIDVDQGSSYKGKLPHTSTREPLNLKKIAGTHVWTFSPANLPSLAARHTSIAIGNAVVGYAERIIRYGLIKAAKRDSTILTGINIAKGLICCEGLAKTFRLPYRSFISLFGAMLPT